MVEMRYFVHHLNQGIMFTRIFSLAACFTFLYTTASAQWGRDVKQFNVIETDNVMVGEADLHAVEINDRLSSKALKLRWNVHKVYPYAQKVAETQAKIANDMQHLPAGVSHREYAKAQEKMLFAQYEPVVRKLTAEQGRILLKLISRQTNTTMYDIVKEDRNAVTAIFWQGVGTLFGVNLKTQFDPEEDAAINAIVQELEMGGTNMVYNSSLAINP